MLETLEGMPAEVLQTIDVYVCGGGVGADKAAVLWSDGIRGEHPWLRVQTHCGGGSFKSQMKKADKSGAHFALLLGESEIADGNVTVKDMRGGADQQTLAQADVSAWLAEHVN